METQAQRSWPFRLFRLYNDQSQRSCQFLIFLVLRPCPFFCSLVLLFHTVGQMHLFGIYIEIEDRGVYHRHVHPSTRAVGLAIFFSMSVRIPD